MSGLGQLYGIGLGPGDPELITLKGWRILQSVDLIFYPASALGGDKERSFSLKIVAQLQLKTPCQALHIPMTGQGREAFYEAAFEQVYEVLKQGKNVAIVSEGDILFYSTFGYLLAFANAKKIHCHLVPGIPAFIAAATEGQQALVEGDSGFRVIARPKNYEQVQEAIATQHTVVVMKMSVLNDWYTFLEEEKTPFFYIEKAGTSEQFTSSNAADLKDRTIPYFSLIIFYGSKNI